MEAAGPPSANAVSNSSRVGKKSGSGPSGRFQLEASWKRASRPWTPLLPPPVALKTGACLGKAAVSNPIPAGNGQPARGHLCFLLKTSGKHNCVWAKLPFPTRGELETTALPRNSCVSNSARFMNEDVRRRAVCFSAEAGGEATQKTTTNGGAQHTRSRH